jgi:hypothetical protein
VVAVGRVHRRDVTERGRGSPGSAAPHRLGATAQARLWLRHDLSTSQSSLKLRNPQVGDLRVLRKDFPALWFIAANHRLTAEALRDGCRRASGRG